MNIAGFLIAAVLLTAGVGFLAAGVDMFLADVEAANHPNYNSTMGIVSFTGFIGSCLLLAAALVFIKGVIQ